MSNFQDQKLYSHILIHCCIHKNDVSPAKQFLKHMSKEHRKDLVIDQVKCSAIASKIKWTYREYHVEDNADVSHKDVKIYCDTNQLPTLPFCGSYPKPHG